MTRKPKCLGKTAMEPEHRQAAQNLLEHVAGGAVKIVEDPLQITPKGRKTLGAQPGLARASLGLVRARGGQCPNCLEPVTVSSSAASGPSEARQEPVGQLCCQACGWSNQRWPDYLRQYLDQP